MDPADLKALIKEGRTCAKNKDWAGVLKAAKTVLRYDDNNYMGLILLGIGLQEQGNAPQSLESYKKASKIKPDDIHCWQGIASHYERKGDKRHQDLVEAYKRISEIYKKESNSGKYIETILKYAGVLQSQGEFSDCVKVLEGCIKTNGHFEKVDQMVVQAIGQIKRVLTKNEEDLYLACLESLHEISVATDDNYKNLFRLLYQMKQYDKLKNVCLSLKSRFNAFYHPIEYLARLYMENHMTLDTNEMTILIDKLFKLYPSSHFGYFAKGKLLYEAKKYSEAIGWLKEGIESKLHELPLTLLVDSQLKVWDFGSAEEYSKLGKKKLRNSPIFDEYYCLALAGQEKWNELRQAMKNLKNVKLLNIITAQMSANEENWEEFDSAVEKLEPSWELQYFKAFKSSEGLKQVCKDNADNFDCLLKCGIQLLNLEDYEGAVSPLNHCLELSPRHPITLFYIGKLCKVEGDLDGAKTCLAKAYEALPNSEIGSYLSDLYFELDDIDANKKLLLSATKNSKQSRSKWAWLRLGVLQLHLGEANDAVVALQSAIRTDIKDCHIWESLADAYYTRGSYEAALKAYKQCIKLGADPVYPRLKIGVINSHLGLEPLAIEALTELGDYVPALVELSKTHLQIAVKQIQEGLDESAVEAISEGLTVASKALKLDVKQQILPLKLVSHLILSACQLNPDSEFQVPSYLSSADGSLSSTEVVNLKSLILVGIRVGITALSKSSSNTLESTLHLDLGKLYYYLATKFSMNCIEKAIYHGKKAVSLAQDDPSTWNSLCVFSFAANNFELAQHCCIKSILLNNAGNPIAWCNLGFIYFSIGESMKAHKCLVEAQSSEPGYGRTWIGMGLVAEKVCPHEAMDLFRHAITIPYTHEFSAFAYSEWLCSAIQNEYQYRPYDYVSSHLDVINTTPDNIRLFNVRSPSAVSLNVEGVLQLHAQRNRSALESFRKASELTEDPVESQIIRQNLIIALLKSEQYEIVLKLVETISPRTVLSLIAAAFASYQLGDYNSAISSYGEALSLSSSPIEVSDILVGQGIVAYKLDDVETAKTLFFKGCQAQSNSEGYLALCSLGLMIGEVELATGVLSEMSLKCKTEKNIHEIALMEACCLVAQAPEPTPLRSIISKIHTYPFNGKLRKVLASHLMNFHADGIGARKHLLNATVYKEKNELAGVAFTYLLEGDYDNALKYSKMSLKMNMGDAVSYAVLIASLNARGLASRSSSDIQLSSKIKNIVLSTGRCSKLPRIHNWLIEYAVA